MGLLPGLGRWAGSVPLLILLLSAVPSRLTAQRREAGWQITVRPEAERGALAGPVLAWRPTPRARFGATVGMGAGKGGVGWMAEAVAQFLFTPARRERVGFYAGGGIGVLDQEARRGVLSIVFGAEQAPGAGAGWSLEAGIGGGIRLGFGYRWRWEGG